MPVFCDDDTTHTDTFETENDIGDNEDEGATEPHGLEWTRIG